MHSAATISDLLRLLTDSLDEVRGGDGVLIDEIEAAAFLVYRAMTNRSRHYHDLRHLFTVASDLPALAKLAAIFHDVVYFPVDRGLSIEMAERIEDVAVFENGRIVLTSAPDEMVSGVMTIFGFTPGQELDLKSGLNEFLSAVIAVKELRPFLIDHDLWAVAACIEATIPFRPDVEGMSPDELLGARLHRLLMDEEKIHAIQILAVKIANSDVQSFGKANLGQFIDNTWQILAETDADFLEAGGYSLRSYRAELSRMEIFLSGLDPEVIWRRHGDVPDDDAYQALQQCSRQNLRGVLDYLQAYHAALAVLEGLAECSGGDGPISCFLSAGNGLSTGPCVSADPVMMALHAGSVEGCRFDRALLPFVGMVYGMMGREGALEISGRVKEVHAGNRDWRWFLGGVPKEVVRYVGKVMVQSSYLRKERLEEWIC